MTRVPCACDGDGDQLSLLCLPVAAKREPTPGVRYAKFRPRTHQVCADCVADIHARGVAAAPYPRPVRWRRTDANGSMHLCEQHKEQRQENETCPKTS